MANSEIRPQSNPKSDEYKLYYNSRAENQNSKLNLSNFKKMFVLYMRCIACAIPFVNISVCFLVYQKMSNDIFIFLEV